MDDTIGCDLCGSGEPEIHEFDGLFYCSSPLCLAALARHETDYIGAPTVRETD